VNDRHEPLEGCTLTVQLCRAGQAAVTATAAVPAIGADSVADLGYVGMLLPPDLPAGDYALELTLHKQNDVLSRNSYPITIVKGA
jgi:hypothetical protein